MISFKDLLGSVPTARRTEQDVTAAGVSIKKADREKLGTSDKLKLSRAAREGGTDKFSFFASDGKMIGDFKTVYDLHMRIESASKAMIQFDMLDVFQVILPATLPLLNSAIEELFVCQTAENQAALALRSDSTNSALASALKKGEQATIEATTKLEGINISTSNLFTSFQDLTDDDVRQSNRYYAMYGSKETVENLTWSSDRMLATCEEDLRDKVREQQVVVSSLESGGPLTLKLMLNLVMDVDEAALRSLIQNLQLLRMKDVAGENVGTVVSYLKGALVLLSNCKCLPTDMMGILNDIFCSAACSDFVDYMKAIYFSHKRGTMVITPLELCALAEMEYRTAYRNGKWTASKSDPDSGFYVDESAGYGGRGGRGGAGGRGGGRRGRGARGGSGGRGSRGGRTFDGECHNCGKIRHYARDCYRAGGGAYEDKPVEDSKEGEDFPGVDDRALKRPPGRHDPRTRTLPDGTVVKWCPECGSWGDHLRADHTT